MKNIELAFTQATGGINKNKRATFNNAGSNNSAALSNPLHYGDLEIYKHLCRDSLIESAVKQDKLREFFRKPFGNSQERFYLAEFCLDYLLEFKKPGDKRKDKCTESILHELRPSYICMDLLNKDILPRRLSYQIINNRRYTIRQGHESIEILFCAILIHDLAEDFTDASSENLKKNLRKRLRSEVPEEHQSHYKKMIPAIGKALDLLTFNDEEGEDYNTYIKNLPTFWAAMLAKAFDRLDGITTRYGSVPDYFTIERDKAYLKDSLLLFFSGQPIEEAAFRYPELGSAFEYVNNMLSVAVRVFDVVTEYHPNNKDIDNPHRKSKNASTAPLEIERRLQDIFRLHNNEESPIIRQLCGISYEAVRKPENLGHIAKAFRRQVEKTLKKHGHSLPECPPFLRTPLPKEEMLDARTRATEEYLDMPNSDLT